MSRIATGLKYLRRCPRMNSETETSGCIRIASHVITAPLRMLMPRRPYASSPMKVEEMLSASDAQVSRSVVVRCPHAGQ